MRQAGYKRKRLLNFAKTREDSTSKFLLYRRISLIFWACRTKTDALAWVTVMAARCLYCFSVLEVACTALFVYLGNTISSGVYVEVEVDNYSYSFP